MSERIESLLKEMTLAEKLGQMTYTSPNTRNPYPDVKKQIVERHLGTIANMTSPEKRDEMLERSHELQKIAVEDTRLGIPLIFGRDTIHGYRTIFPIPLALASSWNPEVVERGCEVSAIEAQSDGINLTFAPMMDVAQDPRWGRIMESYGEDPYLSEVMAVAMVKGFQGEDCSEEGRVAACAKHLAGYGAAVGGRDYDATEITERTMRDLYLRPFKASCEAGVETMMSAFHANGGMCCTGDEWLLRDVLREEWGFRGVLYSDWDSVIEMVPWGMAEDEKEAAEKGIRATVDVEMFSLSYIAHAEALVEEGKVSMELIDASTRRVLELKERMGLFENPYCGDAATKKRVMVCGDHLDEAKKAAVECAVLLKNDEEILPLKSGVKVALIGPMADDAKNQLGSWVTDAQEGDAVTLLKGLESDDHFSVHYEAGLPDPLSEDVSGFENAVAAARDAEVAVVVVGEPENWCGEAHSRAFLDLPGKQQELLEAVEGTGTPVVMVVMSGRPLTIPWAAKHVEGILAFWHPGTMAGPALADLLSGREEPGGRLTASWPFAVGQVPIPYNHRNTGRPPADMEKVELGTPLDPSAFFSGYVDCPRKPLFPFGYGFSYATFSYSELTLSGECMGMDDELSVEITVTNTSERGGTDVVQCYIRDVAASAARPVKELVGFHRVSLEAGESKVVKFVLDANDLAFWGGGKELRYQAEPGRFKVYVGPNSAQVREGSFVLQGEAPKGVEPKYGRLQSERVV